MTGEWQELPTAQEGLRWRSFRAERLQSNCRTMTKLIAKKKGVTPMILDTLEHMESYRALPGMEKIIAFLGSHDLASMADGTYEIDGDDLYVMVQSPALKSEEDALLEAHKLYADLQLVFSGAECMGYAPLETLGAPIDDPEGKDIAFYRGDYQKFFVPEGSFAVFYPGDAHAPVYREGESDRKAVFKIRL